MPPSMITSDDIQFMARAIQLADRGRYSVHPNPRVGCVIVREGDVVGTGWHKRAGDAHAEVYALREAGEKASGATVYVTLEPCSHHGRTPPCAEALIKAGVSRVVVAVEDPNPEVDGRGLTQLRAAGIATEVGVLEEQARALNPGFLRVMGGGRPWLRVKMAASLDGRTAMQSGESQWITGPEARRDVQRLRARSAAIITGAGTARKDNPSMTVRPDEMGPLGDLAAPVGQPLRAVVDGRLSLSPESKLVRGEGRCVVFTTPQGQNKYLSSALARAGAEVVALDPEQPKGIQPALDQVVAWLAREGCNELLLEAGPKLAGAALEARLVDEFWLYQAPVFLGSRARPLAELPLNRMVEKLCFDVTDRRQVGCDQRLILRPAGTTTTH